MSTIDIDRATRLIQFAELDVARYLTDPAEYNTIEYMESVQVALSEALTMLGADPLPIHEGDDYAE
jgi:hypothetical protein